MNWRRRKLRSEYDLPENMYGSFWAFTRVTDSSPTKSLFPSCISPDFKSSETGPTAFPFWKSKTIFFGRTNNLGKSSVSSLVKNLREMKQRKEERNWCINTSRRVNNQQREKAKTYTSRRLTLITQEFLMLSSKAFMQNEEIDLSYY